MRICEVCGKTQQETKVYESKKFNKTLCRRHYCQLSQYGEIMERTVFDKNVIVVNGEICTMELYNQNKEVVAKTTFNRRHLNKIEKFKWKLNNTGYARRSVSGTLLHHLIIPKKEGFDVDHIDRNKLNNQDYNLRYATRSQNLANKICPKGYSWESKRKKWRALISYKGKTFDLGFYETEAEALRARIEGEKKIFADFAPIRNL